MVKRVSPMEGALSTLMGMKEQIITGGNPSWRRDALNDKVGDIEIDTCCAFDTGMWETGINRPEPEGKWVIVKQYKSRKYAETGHKLWVELITKDPQMELKDINLWGL